MSTNDIQADGTLVYETLYYKTFKPAPILQPEPEKTALLIVDMQNEFVRTDVGDALKIKEAGMWGQWSYYYDSLKKEVIPNIKKLLNFFRENQLEVDFAAIASIHKDGKDRSLVQIKEGYNNIFLKKDSFTAQIIDELKPLNGEIVLYKTTDSVLMGTNYERILRNMGIKYVIVTGIVTDQCVSSTVRDLADAGFYVYVPFDATAAATKELRDNELKIINHVYCEVLSTNDIINMLAKGMRKNKG
jgi:nicotinamidase-related amidase